MLKILHRNFDLLFPVSNISFEPVQALHEFHSGVILPKESRDLHNQKPLDREQKNSPYLL